jgi:hypothetical protein
MSWILLTAGYLGGVYMQTWDIYNDRASADRRCPQKSANGIRKAQRWILLPAFPSMLELRQCSRRTRAASSFQFHPASPSTAINL